MNTNLAQRKKTQTLDVNGSKLTREELSASAYCGPLPPATEFERYENVCPGAADRIIKMAERQAAHRQEIEKAVVLASNRNSYTGIFCGLFLATLVLIAGVICILNGHDVAGTSIIGIDLIGLCATFVYGTKIHNQ